ncbi:MAG: 1-deoxy-D-xylulose-5-phosphate reductoisomerase [Ruminococcaceae bacterium]|nr:1-deoxy-D-xylulose-5-phosphate reductoisomerase [Oscillospiraceae bacterium]
MIENKVSFDLLGSTGSIGEQAIDVARQTGSRIVSLCANKNDKRVAEQAREFKVSFCAMADEGAAKSLRLRLSDTDIKVFGGASGIEEMIAASDAEVTLNAVLGEAGLSPTLAAIQNGKALALANKESLVVAGELVMAAVKEHGTRLTPVDSEHCAIHQCLSAGKKADVKRLIVTASGGAFFGKKKEELRDVTVEMALAHPTWSMGAKITIDSATLMNKGFELIEASRLFCIEMDKIDAIIHRESIIHSMVEYIDNSVIAQMSMPDMRSCIAYGLFGGERRGAVIEALDFAKISRLTFYEPDEESFPLLRVAKVCGRIGGGMPAVLNAANEVVVDAFLKGKIRFGSIAETVALTVEALGSFANAHALSDILAADKAAREYAAALLLGKG